MLGESGEHEIGEYVVGWVKRGPSGVIGTNKKDATDTVARILEDRDAGKLNTPKDADPASCEQFLSQQCPELVTWEGWRAIDAHETGLGEPQGRPRVKLVRTGEMVDIAAGTKRLDPGRGRSAPIASIVGSSPNARDRVPRWRTARDRRAPRPHPGRGRAADRAHRRSASAAPTSRSSRARWPTSGWGSPQYPIVPGHEWTGEVVDVGAGVTGFAPGDRVVGEVAIGCGVCVRCRRAAATSAPAHRDRHRPHGRRDGLAAGLPGRVRAPRRARAARRRLVEPTSVALHAVRRGRVGGQRVLVVGAGPIGLLVAQCARAEGAADVVVTDTREDRLTRPPRSAPRRRCRARALGRSAAATGCGRGGAIGERDRIDVAILCAGGPAAIAVRVRGGAPRRDGRRARALGRAERSRSTSTAWSSATSTSSACSARSATGRARSPDHRAASVRPSRWSPAPTRSSARATR